MNLQVIKNRVKKILAYTITGIVFLLISAFLILQMPPVQNAIVGKVLRNFSNVSGFVTKIESFRLLWFDRLELENVSITDPEGNTMISAGSIQINFNITELLNQDDINIDGIVLDSAQVYLTMIHESDTSSDLNINIFIHELNELSKGEGKGKNPQVNIGEAVLNQSQFSYIHQYRDSIPNGFDYNHFTLDIDEGQIRNFLVLGDTIEFDVATLIVQDRKTQFNIHQLSTFFRISQASMEFTGLQLQAGQSMIRDTIIFTYDSQRDLRDFVNKVQIHARLDSTIIDPDDLELFAPGVKQIRQQLAVTGEFNGRINRFKVQNMRTTIGNSQLIGSLDMDGLPEIQETFIILNLKNSNLDFNDFRFLLKPKALERLQPIGRLRLNGQFLGYPTDFVANGDIMTDLGRIKSDINFKVDEENFDRSTYAGRLAMINFDIGRYLQDTVTFQRVSLDGNLKGKGLTQTTADFKLNGKVNSLGINGYNYTNITTNANFASEFFNGSISIDDPNLEFNAKGSVDLRNQQNIIKIQAHLDTAYLHRLNLSRKEVFLQTDLDVDIKGLQLDSLEGIADFKNFRIDFENESMSLESIHLDAQKEGRTRLIDLQTTPIDARIEGDFTFSDLGQDIKMLTKEIALNIKNDEKEISKYYQSKSRKPRNYQAAFTFSISDIKPVSNLLKLDLSVSKNTVIEGSFTSGYTTIFRAFAVIDSIQYQNTLLLKTDAEITASKIADSTNVLAMAYVTSQRQSIGNGLNTRDLMVEAIWDKSHIEFGIDCDQQDQDNYVRLKGEVDFMTDSTRLKMLPSRIHLLDRNWHIESTNEIVGNRHEWSFRNLELLNRDQSILINGKLSDDPDKKMILKVSNIDLSILNVITNKKFEGVVNGDIEMSDYYHNPSIENDIAISQLTINDFLIGDITGKNIWNNTARKFDISFFIDRMNTRIVNLEGEYTPANESPLDLKAQLEKANLRILETFLEELFGNLGGTVTGTFDITGTLDHPVISGEGQIQNGQFMLQYTKALYQFTGVIGLEQDAIVFRNIELTDTYKNKGRLTGRIRHRNFYQMEIDLQSSFRNFHLLNTTARDNSLFYGQGFASGDVTIKGPVSNLIISSNARTEKNTRIYIPIGGTNSVEKEEFINFINFSDSTLTIDSTKSVSKKINLSGLAFDLNLEVTPDAYCEIIFDIKAGDIIRGRSSGEMKLQLDTKGEFNMFGTVEFTEGWYNFTLYDIINKEFEIQKGSRITWYGDPYGATLDINAVYNQLASFAPIVNDPSISNAPELRRKYPVQVLLKLDGPMLTPQINFDITASELPQSVTIGNSVRSLDLMFESFKNKLDEQGLKKQVFSLIVLRKFMPPETFNTSGSLYNSVSELLSNQLSYWMSQVDENLEIDVDLGTMDQEAFNTFQLRLSYTFLNGRLRITRDGTFGNADYNNQATQNRGNVASIAGDWTVDYFLTADGKFKVKMYNRTNYNQLSTSLNNQSYFTTGVSLQHVQSFNELKDLLPFIKKSNPANEERNKESEFNKDAKKEEDGG